MMTCGKYSGGIVAYGLHAYHHHLFRKIYISALCILLVNGCYHKLIAKEQLIFCLLCRVILGEIKCKRSEHHFIIQRCL